MAWKTNGGGTSGSDPTYLEPRVTAIEVKTNNMAKVPNQQSWIATEGQTDFAIDNGSISNVKLLDVYIGGVPQDEITLLSPTTFQVSEALSAGMKVMAEWFEVEIPLGQTHKSTHEAGGVDELDVTRLKNYNVVDKKTGGLSDPREYGAVGDGVTDDTVALQSWLNATGKSRVLRNGIFRITSGLTSSESGRTIKTDGATILVDSITDITVLTVTGDNSKISVDINGQNKAAIGVNIQTGGCEVKKCRIESLLGVTNHAVGIKAETSNGVRIEENTILNVSATGNSTIGDMLGSARAVLVTSTTDASALNIVKNNTIAGILGEEGDAIQFLFYNGSTTPFLNAQGIIQGNIIKNCNRRAIKVQASNVRVKNNEHFNTLLLSDVPNAAVLIDIIQSDDVVVHGNSVDASLFMGIQITGSVSKKAKRVIVKNNTVKGDATFVKNGLFFDNIQDCQIDNNTIYDGATGLAIQNSLNCTINDNLFYGGDATKVAINIVSSNSDISASGNLLISGARLYLVQNAAPNCVVENNHSRASAGGNIRTFSTAAGSIYRNNTNASSTTTIIGDFTDQYMSGSRNISTGASGSPDISFASAIPTTTNFPTKRFNVGDIVFNTVPLASGKIGWVCITAGTPGTWKPFGAIDA